MVSEPCLQLPKMKTIRLAVVSTHPIQYYAPIFQQLAQFGSLRLKVFYTWSQTSGAAVADEGFGRTITWDIPLLEGYESEFIPNISSNPGTDRFSGLRNPQLNPAIEAWNADAVLVFGWNSESHLNVMRYFSGRKPVFFRGDSTLLDSISWWRSLARRAVLTWVYRHVDVAIAVGANNREYFRWCGIPEARIAFAPHAIDTLRFSDPSGSHQAQAEQWRRELGIASDSKVILFAGKLIPKKDPILLLEAFTRCGASGHLVFVGNGILEAELRARVGDRRDVHFLPFQNQQAMPAVYRLGDVYVLPSRGPGETWGLAINEAMASERAVIVSNKAGGARDLITEGVTGWTFRFGDLGQLTTAVSRVLTDHDGVIRAMGRAARTESVRWSIQAAAQGIERAVAEFFTRSMSLS
jgi:glycosyltransferase involved in cell wall biosynthesis